MRKNTLTADVEEHSLLKVILIVRVSTCIEQHLHHFIGLVVIENQSRKMECWLTRLELKTTHNLRGVRVDLLRDLLYRTA